MENWEFCGFFKPMLVRYIKCRNSFFQDLFSRSVTWGYMGIQGITGRYRGLQGVTGDYKGLKGVTGGYKGLQGVTKDTEKLKTMPLNNEDAHL